jgi:hypothetical protein
VKTFFTSVAAEVDLTLLINLRDGVVHAALDEEVKERLLVAFVQQVDATLVDMGRSRDDFWGDRRAMVDALLVAASDKVTRRVQVKLAAARAAFEERYGETQRELREFVKTVVPRFDEREEVTECPACGCKGVAKGEHSVNADVSAGKDGELSTYAWVEFAPVSFSCQACCGPGTSRGSTASHVTHRATSPGARE